MNPSNPLFTAPADAAGIATGIATDAPQAAFAHNGALVARARFYAIACDPRRSVVVEACAGAGKTWMLVSRMLRALMEGCAPQDMLAITFTKKAAGEMRQRLQQWLQEFAHASDAALRQALHDRGLPEASAEQLATLRGLHGALLENGRPVQIRTFHSWFAALLHNAPLGVLHSLGLPTAYELLEDDQRATALVWRRFYAGLLREAASHADYSACVALHGRHATQQALQAALDKRTEFALADAQGVVDASVQTFGAQFPALAQFAQPNERLRSPAVQDLLWASARALGASSLKTCAQAASSLERALTQGDVAAVYEALFTDKGQGDARKLSEKVAGIETVREAQALLAETRQAQQQHAAWEHQQRMARLARRLLADYAALKREQGWIDMADLERAALALLSDAELSGWVQERLDARVRHLLIDEFQDTNPLQWQALSSWLGSYAGAGYAPSVFIVGDPKQSIYRFRRAEPQVFQAAKAFVVNALSGDLLGCDHTRRNAPAIVGLVNRAMGDLQAAGQYSDFRAHTTESRQSGQVLHLPVVLRPARPSAAPQDAWRDSLSTPRWEAQDSHKTLECRQAAQWLAQQLRAPGATLRASDVMVLARKRERLGLMQAELAALHIAAQQPEKKELAELPAVQDLIALLDALVSPRHDAALARALKSPLFGASDADLVQLVRCLRNPVDGAEGSEQPAPLGWWQVLQTAPPGLPADLAAAGRTLARWKQWVGRLPPHDALCAIYQDGDVLARYARSAADSQREAVLAALNALLDAALNVDGGRYTSAYTLVRRLRQGGLAAPVRAQSEAVRLLTIHGAKGLEAPLVLLLDTDAEPARAESMGVLVDWPGEAAQPQRFVFLASESRPPACAQAALETEQAARAREECNALYVAITRTQHTLVLSSAQPRSPRSESWWARLHEHAQAAPALNADPTPDGATTPTPPPAAQEYLLHVLPPYAPPAAPSAALPGWFDRKQHSPSAAAAAVTASSPASASTDDSPISRIGRAMHRLLEWLLPQPGGAQAAWPAEQLQQVQRSFALDNAQLQHACALARGIVQGEAAWAWDADQLRWHGNEVPITHAGNSLRIDRLVQRGSEWWVLDYKSAAQPERQPALLAQLRDYRKAVARAYPGQPVRAAFLTPQGIVREVLSDSQHA